MLRLFFGKAGTCKIIVRMHKNSRVRMDRRSHGGIDIQLNYDGNTELTTCGLDKKLTPQKKKYLTFCISFFRNKVY